MNDLPAPQAIPVRAGADFSGMSITRARSGHLTSPWFSFGGSEGVDHRNFKTEMNPAQATYQSLRAAAIWAFSDVTHQRPDDIFVSEKIDPFDGSRWWMLSTRYPCPLPAPAKKKPEVLLVQSAAKAMSTTINPGMTDIEIKTAIKSIVNRYNKESEDRLVTNLLGVAPAARPGFFRRQVARILRKR